MQQITNVKRHSSPKVSPQALAWDGRRMWLSSRDLKRLYRLNPRDWLIEQEIEPPGVVWAAVALPDGMRLTIGLGGEDDRYVYRYTEDGGFEQLFACPEFTGSYLSFDGDNLYLSQWYKGRILRLDARGDLLDEINVGHEIAGHVIVDKTLYVVRGTEQNGESWHIGRVSSNDRNPHVEELASVPFAARSLTYDGNKFWSNHRAANETISFSISDT